MGLRPSSSSAMFMIVGALGGMMLSDMLFHISEVNLIGAILGAVFGYFVECSIPDHMTSEGYT